MSMVTFFETDKITPLEVACHQNTTTHGANALFRGCQLAPETGLPQGLSIYATGADTDDANLIFQTRQITPKGLFLPPPLLTPVLGFKSKARSQAATECGAAASWPRHESCRHEMKVLVAIDSSASASAAVALVVARRWSDGTEFRLVSVIKNKPRSIVDVPTDAGFYHVRRILERATDSIRAKNPSARIQTEICVGNPARKILENARSWSADLIIVGSEKRSFFRRIYQPSVSQKVLRRAECSVIIARDSSFWPSGLTPFKRVMIVLNENSYDALVSNLVHKNQWSQNTRFHVFATSDSGLPQFVFQPCSVAVLSALDEEENKCKTVAEMTRTFVAKLKKRSGFRDVEYSVTTNSSEELILDAAKHWRAELILFGDDSKSNELSNLLFGTLAERVAMQADCAVQIVREHSLQQTQQVAKLDDATNLQLVLENQV